MKSLVTRTITGLTYAALLILAVVYSSLTAELFFLAVAAFCIYEIFKITGQSSHIPRVILGIATVVLLIHAGTFRYEDPAVRPLIFSLSLLPYAVFFLIGLFSKKEKAFHHIAYVFFGLVYIALPFTLLLNTAYCFEGTYNYAYLLVFIFIIWANDTGAYLTGGVIGKTKFFERVSPKKTWEGTIGGIFSGTTAGIVSSLYFDTALSQVEWAVISIIIAVSATLGDLIESRLKRSFDIKDSGNILPGHGGFLDRFDSVLFAAPVYFFLLVILEKYSL